MTSNFRHTAEEIRRYIENSLFRVGLLCRVFARGKDVASLNDKLLREPGKYSKGGKLIQDAVGIRVVLYFEEDVSIVEQMLAHQFDIDRESSTIDLPTTDQFTVSRHNFICKIPPMYLADMNRWIGANPIDATFEVQIRSVLSEGWHEVDHDLRYKSKASWKGQDDLSRALNGILATLETSEWTMKRIFDDLSYRHYRKRQWAAMLHTKMRMRTRPELSPDLLSFLDGNADFAKELFRINRNNVIQQISRVKPGIPISLDNILYVWNWMELRNEFVSRLTPAIVTTSLVESNK